MEILMPQLGETMAEGKITTWFKAIGDAVKPGDNLFEIETDKTSMEVPATSTGVLTEIRVREGDVVAVDGPLVMQAADCLEHVVGELRARDIQHVDPALLDKRRDRRAEPHGYGRPGDRAEHDPVVVEHLLPERDRGAQATRLAARPPERFDE